MLGKPKFKYSDIVKFKIQDKEYVGEIYIVDEYGIWADPSDVYYDILVKDAFKEGDKYYNPNGNNDCLYKHIPEKKVEPFN